VEYYEVKMIQNKRIAVVIPSYKVRNYLNAVVTTLPQFIDDIIVVDDRCPEKCYEVIEGFKKVIVVHHQKNQGVGGAVISGYKKAIELDADIIIKIDGDGQMDPKYLQKLIDPLIKNQADYTKGNRFTDFKALKQMPKVRLFGNSALSFLVKASSGYWNMMDPTNGYTAISKDAILGLDLDKLSKRYFFESDMLINLNIENCVVKDIPIPAKYEDEQSSLSIAKVLIDFPPKLFKGFLKRVFYKYFIYNFNMASIYLIFGFPMFLFGFCYGSISWYQAVSSGTEATTGTVMLSALPIILGVQFLLQAISIDIDSVPKKIEK